MANKTGPNEPCPCGSGSKYKQCCGRPGVQSAEANRRQMIRTVVFIVCLIALMLIVVYNATV